MSDDADRADRMIEQTVADAIAAARRARALPYTGLCHWCGDVTGGGRRFCDADCRDDWERAHAAASRR